MHHLLSDLTGQTNQLASKAGPGGVDPYQPGVGIVYGDAYTPELAPSANVTPAKLKTAQCMFTRVGPNVSVAGTVRVGSTLAANTITKFHMSLPVPSDLGFAIHLSGSGARSGTGLAQPVMTAVQIRGDVTGNRAEFIFNSTSAAEQDITFMFKYGII